MMIALVRYTVLFSLRQDVFSQAVRFYREFFKEMGEVLPPIFLITAFITVWVPEETIERGSGSNSGWKGEFISLFIGPVYAAFPATAAIYKKSASISNVVIIIRAWAVVKIPMLITETTFLGLRFALTRYLLTVPFILLLGWGMEKMIKREEVVTSEELDAIEAVLKRSPGKDCRACGYAGCEAFASGVVQGEVTASDREMLEREATEENT